MSKSESIYFPPEYEPTVYRLMNSDLIDLNENELLNHFLSHGITEGRVSNSVVSRPDFLRLIPKDLRCLEIGPFDAPCLHGENVDYFDLMSQKEMADRATQLNRNPDSVPFIKWYSTEGHLDIINEKYDIVFSCHSIEHQFDLVRHLQEVSNILESKGFYFLIIPDYRYCFDAYLFPSSIADVLDAFENGRSRHTLKSVLEHRVLTTHNDPVRHWAGDHGTLDLSFVNIGNAIEEYKKVSDSVDVHAWQFTPESFRQIIKLLFDLRMTNLKISRCYQTLRNNFEFMAILEKVSD